MLIHACTETNPETYIKKNKYKKRRHQRVTDSDYLNMGEIWVIFIRSVLS